MPILQYWFSLYLSWRSKGCLIVCPRWVCFTLVYSIPSNTLPYPFTSHSTIFQPLSVHILISSTFTSCGMRYYCCSVILFSFLSFPKFHRVVPLLQTCSTTEFVYDHACFCVYIYLRIYLPCMRENMHLLCFWSGLLNMMSSNCIHLPSKQFLIFNHLWHGRYLLGTNILFIYLFMCLGLGLNSGLHAYKAGILLLEPHLQSRN
jgi:hypothetical protein